MSGLRVFEALQEAEKEARRREQTPIGTRFLDGLMILTAIAGIIIAALVLAGCAALAKPEPVPMCKRCNARPVAVQYTPQGGETEIGLCVPCAHWMGGRIRRKAVRR